ncbi:MAG: DUF4252 domain-containing protein [Pyrinomonadaceae bacterium]|nr:DUF4252 domain-containing protein [Pyrinomonadaceae bacterium]
MIQLRTKIFPSASLKTLYLQSLLTVFFVTLSATAQTNDNARLQMVALDHLAPRAAEVVDIQIDERLLQVATKYLSGSEPDEARVRELVAGLKGIYVKSFEFGEEGVYTEADLNSVRAQLRAPGWSRIIEVRSRREEENVEIYVRTGAEGITGLTVISFAPRELTVINILGAIDLDKLSRLQGQFGIPQLELERGGRAAKPPSRKN